MKKLLFWILTFLLIWLSFCSALTIQDPELCKLYTWTIDWPDSVVFQDYNNSLAWNYFMWWTYDLSNWYADISILTEYWWEYSLDLSEESYYYYSAIIFSSDWCSSNWWWSLTSDIDVYYNNWNSVENITCDWTQAIDVRWLSTITSTNTFTPYFNISYTDEDNQKLTESYSKSNLYLSGWLFKKTYTWDNERILTDTIDSPNSVFSWYIPVFDVTWSTQPIDTEYNMFNNFTDNSLKVLLSNIPSFFQYVIIFSIILMIIWIIKVFKRKK